MLPLDFSLLRLQLSFRFLLSSGDISLGCLLGLGSFISLGGAAGAEEGGGSWRVAAWTGGWRRSGEEEVIIGNHQETVETDFLRICRFSMKIHALA